MTDSAPQADASRIIRTITGPFEQRVLPVLARALPDWVTPDMLTVLGMIASVVIGLLYGFSGPFPEGLWLINLLLIVHWYADSLDGTLARVRKIERPRYGFFLDHAADSLAALCICLGLGLSPHMRLGVALCLLLGYYLMMIQVLLRAYTLREFKISYGRFGPTELRILLILVNIGLWIELRLLVKQTLFTIRGVGFPIFDVIGIVAAIALVSVFLGTFLRSLRRLAELEPPGVRRE